MDWDLQPDPFRRWSGTELLPLAHVPFDGTPHYESVFAGRCATARLDRRCISQLLFDSLALSAWKRAGDAHWSLRVNPSSGNLHPTEAYVLGPAIAGLSATPFVAHYAPAEHALEVRARLTAALWSELTAQLPQDSLLVALTSVHWREAWKYGERAFRYCNHDVGHALACLTLAAAALGYRATLLDELGTDEVELLTGLSALRQVEPECADLAIVLHPMGSAAESQRLPAAAVARFADLAWQGTPNQLSKDREDWDVIDAVATAVRKPAGPHPAQALEPTWPPLVVGDEPIDFRRIVHGRRSAVAMDGRTGLARDAFYQTLRRTLPGHGEAPFATLPWTPRVHLALFVHRIAELDPGLYFLVRAPQDEADLRQALAAEHTWEKPPGCPSELPLFRLRTGDARGLAARVSCDQAIAGDGCFRLGMLARVERTLREDGAWMYPRLFWETGVIGQALYLEAEALGLRATGIGCFYDDSVHGALGLRDRAWQSLYHFTIGGPVDDTRITTEPAYAALRE